MKNKLLYILKHPLRIPLLLLIRLPYFDFIKRTTDYQCPNTFSAWFIHKVLNIGGNRQAYWPVHFTSKVINPRNIYAGIDTCPGMMGGCYIQAIGKIYIGDYTQIASNVAIISANHDLYNTRKHVAKEVKIGKYCWIGTGAAIMPGVILGDFTIVGAGSIVTKSFAEGFCVIAGNPAKKIKTLEMEKCIPHKNKYLYNGYILSEKFSANPRKYMNI
ncbi:MAG: acyltransferase [Agriterribacter sp.]